MDKEALLSSIRQTVESDLVSYPKWVAAQKTLKTSKLASSSTELKVFLRHVTFPGVLQGYHDLCAELHKATGGAAEPSASAEDGSEAETKQEQPSSSTSSYHIPLDIVPLSSKNGGNDSGVRDFFQSISRGNKGSGHMHKTYRNMLVST